MTGLPEQPGPYAHNAGIELAPPRPFVLVVDREPAPARMRALPRPAMVLPEVGLPHVRVRFDWPAPTLAEAVLLGVHALESAGLRVLRVDNDDYATASDLALRVGRSREAVRLWAAGRMGPGGFPPPLNPRRDTTFYSWAETLPWLRERLRLDLPEEDPALVAVNLALRLRALLPRVRTAQAVIALLTDADETSARRPR